MQPVLSLARGGGAMIINGKNSPWSPWLGWEVYLHDNYPDQQKNNNWSQLAAEETWFD